MKNPMQRHFRCRLKPLNHALVAASLVLTLPAAVHAQSIKGGVYGTVDRADAAQGKLIVQNVNTNAVQSRKLASDGRYKVDGLTPGSYRIELSVNDAIVDSRMVYVRAGGSSPVPTLSRTTNLGAVKVTVDAINASADNTAPIDVSTPMLAHNYSAELLRKTGVDTSLSSVGGSYANVLTSLPSHFMSQVNNGEGSGLAGFNGGSGTESRYYIDEFDTTYDYTGAGANAVPGEAIGNATVIANGASAKYSNAMGGSISGYVKQGDNTWRGGVAEYYLPPSSKWLNQKNRTYPLDNGTYYIDDSSTNGHNQPAFNTTAWLSGPIIKDRLFFYAVMQTNAPRSVSSYTYNNNTETNTGNYAKFSNRTSWPLLNLTWNITSNQQMDLMGSRFRATNDTSIYSLTAPRQPDTREYVDSITWHGEDKLLLGHYRWDIDDDTNLQVMGGYLSHFEQNVWSDSGPYASEITSPGGSSSVLHAGESDNTLPYNYNKRGFRADFSKKIGDHKLQIGAEDYRIHTDAMSEYGGKGIYTYYAYSQPTAGNDRVNPSVVIPANTPYVMDYTAQNGGKLSQTNRGAYIEDYWQATNNVLIYGGFRRDNAKASLADGQHGLDLYTNSPRLGVSWDVRGDSSMKIGFSAGEYSLPVPGIVMDSLFNNYSYNYTYSTYTGINADGSPVGAKQFAAYSIASSAANAKELTAGNLKNSLQDNYTLYMQDNQFIPNWSETLELDYSKIKRALSVWSDLDAGSGVTSTAYAYLQSLGYADPYIKNYVLINPGQAVTLTNDFNHDGKLETVTIPGSETGLPKPKREAYTATIDLVHPETTEQPFFLDFSYSWKHVHGNYEGYYGETNGNVLGAPTLRFAGLSSGSSGDLPGDVRNTVRINLSHTFAHSITAGLGSYWQSGNPRSCYSTYPDSGNAASEAGESSFYCNGVLTPRGSLGHMPSYWNLDLHVGWTHKVGANTFSVQFGVNNVLNRQMLIYRDPFQGYYNNGSFVTETRYDGRVYTAARSSWLSLRYAFN